MIEDVFSKMRDAELVMMAKHLIDEGIEDAKDAIDSVCKDCMVSKILMSYDATTLDAIIVGLSIAVGFVGEQPDGEDCPARIWLKHAVKVRFDTQILDADILEMEK